MEDPSWASKAPFWLKRYLIFFIQIGQSFIDCFGRYFQIVFRVSVANIPMMVRGEKDAPTDQLSVKIIASGAMSLRFVPLKGYEKHGRNTA